MRHGLTAYNAAMPQIQREAPSAMAADCKMELPGTFTLDLKFVRSFLAQLSKVSRVDCQIVEFTTEV